MKPLRGQPSQAYTEQPVDLFPSILSPVAQEQLALGSVALGTILGMTLLLREVRLLVQACKA